MPSITVQGNPIRILETAGEKYISLTDMGKKFGDANILIASWMRRKDIIEYLGIWERLHNEYFNPLEFVGVRIPKWSNPTTLKLS